MNKTFRVQHLPVAEYLDMMSASRAVARLCYGDVIIQAPACAIGTDPHHLTKVTQCAPWARVETIVEEGPCLRLELIKWSVNQGWQPNQDITQAFCKTDGSFYVLIPRDAFVSVLTTSWTRNPSFDFSLEAVAC